MYIKINVLFVYNTLPSWLRIIHAQSANAQLPVSA